VGAADEALVPRWLCEGRSGGRISADYLRYLATHMIQLK